VHGADFAVLAQREKITEQRGVNVRDKKRADPESVIFAERRTRQHKAVHGADFAVLVQREKITEQRGVNVRDKKRITP